MKTRKKRAKKVEAHPVPIQKLDRDWLTPKQAANYLGVNVWTVRRYINEGFLPASKLGSGKMAHWRISASSIEKMLEGSRTIPR